MVYDENDPMDHYPYRNRGLANNSKDLKTLLIEIAVVAVFLGIAIYLSVNTPIN